MPKFCSCRKPEQGKTNCKKCGYPIKNSIPIDTLRQELSKCSNLERIKELKVILDNFDYGIDYENCTDH